MPRIASYRQGRSVDSVVEPRRHHHQRRPSGVTHTVGPWPHPRPFPARSIGAAAGMTGKVSRPVPPDPSDPTSAPPPSTPNRGALSPFRRASGPSADRTHPPAHRGDGRIPGCRRSPNGIMVIGRPARADSRRFTAGQGDHPRVPRSPSVAPRSFAGVRGIWPRCGGRDRPPRGRRRSPRPSPAGVPPASRPAQQPSRLDRPSTARASDRTRRRGTMPRPS
jgi:hypothetical protein